jgi:hypothetical protein
MAKVDIGLISFLKLSHEVLKAASYNIGGKKLEI